MSKYLRAYPRNSRGKEGISGEKGGGGVTGVELKRGLQ